MANEHGLFFDSVNGDRVYNSDSFAEWLQKFFTTGVFNGDLQVQPSSGMAVTVGTGYANINGRVRFFDTTQTKTLSVANGTYPRIDTIVVRLDLGNREITCETVQGMYSGNNPSPTAPVRSDGIYEIVLAQIYVGAGVTEITAANITDTRADDTLCGWVTSTVEGVPMSQIVSQMQAEFETWYDHMKDQLDEDAAGHLQLEIDSINSLITELRRIVDSHDGNMATVVSDTATEAFSTGAYVMKNNAFRKVTRDISSGDTIDDTNTESTTIGAELTALNNGLTTYQELPITRLKTPSRADILRGYRIGKVAFITFNNVSYSEAFSTDTAVIKVPEPVLPIRGTFYDQTRTFVSAYIDSNGNVTLNGYTAGRLIYGTIIYPIAD